MDIEDPADLGVVEKADSMMVLAEEGTVEQGRRQLWQEIGRLLLASDSWISGTQSFFPEGQMRPKGLAGRRLRT